MIGILSLLCSLQMTAPAQGAESSPPAPGIAISDGFACRSGEIESSAFPVSSALQEFRSRIAGGTDPLVRHLRSTEEAGETKPKTSGDFPSGPLDYFLLVLMIEGGIALNSYLASLNPDVYGGFEIAMAFPAAALCEGCEKPEAVTAGIALAGLGAYNLTLDEDQLSSGDIFKKNFVGWHVVAAAIGLSALATEHGEAKPDKGAEGAKERAGILRVAPVPRGIALAYRFRF